MITFLGAGMLGTGFVRALRGRGETVHVWNRSHDKAKALEAHGAKAFEDPARACEGADRVHVVLSDDAAVDETLERARPALPSGALIVDHTTTAPSSTAERVARWDERGARFVHAPVFMGPGNALASTGIMLVCGARDRVDAARPHLAKMTGKLVDLGDAPTQAAKMKLLGNLFLMFVTSGLAEVFGLAKAMGMEPEAAAALFAEFNPGLTLPMRIERMLSRDFASPSWGLAMARKDARLMQQEADLAGEALAVLPAIAARMDALIARGHGGDDWTVLGADALGPRA
jgi:3-hydroxyisobutyrate dehydrogenase